jgi:lipocalin
MKLIVAQFVGAAAILAASDAAVAAPFAGPRASSVCPPANFDSVKGFDLSAYLGQWYAQAQAPVNYAPLSENYCVAAKYTLKADGESIDVFNQDRKNSVTGAVNKVHLNGAIPNKSDPSKIKVIFPLVPFPKLFGADYWVVATGPIVDGKYDWAIISGGAPTQENKSNNLCIAPRNAGFWLFTRESTPPKAKVDMLKSTAQSIGLDVTALNNIEHNGCSYVDN